MLSVLTLQPQGAANAWATLGAASTQPGQEHAEPRQEGGPRLQPGSHGVEVHKMEPTVRLPASCETCTGTVPPPSRSSSRPSCSY